MANYVDNTKLYEVLVEYKRKIVVAKDGNLQKPRVPEYVGACLLLIAQRLATKPNFNAYPFKEEMISDALENCCMYLDNFNTDKYDNPFAYFTQIIYFAFIRRISKEKKQLYIKQKVMEKMVISNEIIAQEVDLDNEKMHDIVINFEEKAKQKELKNGKAKVPRKRTVISKPSIRK